MNIQKIIKFYFVFTMCLLTSASLSTNDEVQHFMASVLSADVLIEENVVIENESDARDVFSINFENDPANAYAIAGAEDKKIMTINFSAFDKKVFVRDLRFKLIGVETAAVSDLRLIESGGDVLSKGRFDGEYFVFSNIDIELETSEKLSADLVLNVGEELISGNRFRMDLNAKSDIIIFVDGKRSELAGHYPIRGKYFSIVGRK